MIEGKLVSLRGVEKEDIEALMNWRNKESFRRNFREHRELTTRDQLSWIESLDKTKHINYMFSIIDQEGRLIGACGLLYINWIARFADFSFYIGDSDEYCKGERSEEACELLINYGFNILNLNKIWMELYEFDTDKISHFTSKFGFVQDGILRENCYHNGRYYDSHIYSLLRRDFRS